MATSRPRRRCTPIWLATRTRVRDKTLRGYTAHVRLHLVPHLGQVLLAELDTARLDRAFTALLRQDGPPSRPGTGSWRHCDPP